MIQIKSADLILINNYKKEAERSGLVFCGKTKYFAIYETEKIVGFAGLLICNSKAIDKNIYILPEFRGMGYFKYWLDWRLNLLKKMSINRIEATCTSMSLNEYLKRGAKIIKQYKQFTKVIHENI